METLDDNECLEEEDVKLLDKLCTVSVVLAGLMEMSSVCKPVSSILYLSVTYYRKINSPLLLSSRVVVLVFFPNSPKQLTSCLFLFFWYKCSFLSKEENACIATSGV